LQKLKSNNLIFSNFVIKVLSASTFFILWFIIAAIVDSSILPGPITVIKNMIHHIYNGDLVLHTGITLARVLAAFFISMVIGTVIGIIMGRSSITNSFLDDWLVLGLNIPALVIIILCYIWFGLTEVAAILAVSLNKIPLVAVTIREGARDLDTKFMQVAQIYHIGRKKTLTQVFIPQLYPYLMAAARSGLSLIWKIVLVVELLGRSNGVGFQLHSFFQFFDIASILSYTLVFVAIVLSVEILILRPLEKKLMGWRL